MAWLLIDQGSLLGTAETGWSVEPPQMLPRRTTSDANVGIPPVAPLFLSKGESAKHLFFKCKMSKPAKCLNLFGQAVKCSRLWIMWCLISKGIAHLCLPPLLWGLRWLERNLLRPVPSSALCLLLPLLVFLHLLMCRSGRLHLGEVTSWIVTLLGRKDPYLATPLFLLQSLRSVLLEAHKVKVYGSSSFVCQAQALREASQMAKSCTCMPLASIESENKHLIQLTKHITLSEGS